MRNLSFAYCELTSLVVLTSQPDSRAMSTKTKELRLKQKNALATQVDRVGEYIVKALDGDVGGIVDFYRMTRLHYHLVKILISSTWVFSDSLIVHHAFAHDMVPAQI